MKKLKIGVIGLGVGEQHLQAYQEHPGCEVVTLCDFSKEKIMSIKPKYPHIKIVEDADEILLDKSIDAVSVASYDNYHYEHIIKALKNNKHVFVEKPLCLYRTEAVKIRRLLKSKPRLKLSSNLILRKSPLFQHIKEMIKNKKFGDIYYIEGDYNYGRLSKLTDGWRGDIDFYSIIYGGGVHIVDLILWLTKDRVAEVFTYGNRITARGSKFKYNDFCASLLRFKSGMVAKIACNFGCVSPHFHNLTVYGTKATFINEFAYGRFIISRDRKDKEKKIMQAYQYPHKGGLIKNFIDSIIKGAKPDVSADDLFKAMSICFAMEESSYISKPVKVDYI